MNKFFFPLRDGYYYGRYLNKELRQVLGNKLVQDSEATGLLSQAVEYAGDGDYIEIGSLHGGSAITVALVKKQFNLEGDIFCIEPNPRSILENAKLCGVEDRIKIIKSYSYEINLGDSKFTCGLIDGDHRPQHPITDWDLLSKKVSKYIIFDDFDRSERGVELGVRYVLEGYPEWLPVQIRNAIAIFERRKFK
jgi:predicted O-methyltransferase YrrM